LSFVLANPDEPGFVPKGEGDGAFDMLFPNGLAWLVPNGEGDGAFDMLFPNGLDWVVPNGELAGGAADDELNPELENPVEGGCVANGD